MYFPVESVDALAREASIDLTPALRRLTFDAFAVAAVGEKLPNQVFDDFMLLAKGADELTEVPLMAAVFSHNHVDHIFGVTPFEQQAAARAWPRPRVYAHALVRRNFDRYLKTLGWNTAINLRQFGLPPDRFRWPDQYRYPDIEFHDRLTFTAGDLTFELHHARGETEDAVWAWIPERKILAPGDLFIWATPNAGNPQGRSGSTGRQPAQRRPARCHHLFPITA